MRSRFCEVAVVQVALEHEPAHADYRVDCVGMRTLRKRENTAPDTLRSTIALAAKHRMARAQERVIVDRVDDWDSSGASCLPDRCCQPGEIVGVD